MNNKFILETVLVGSGKTPKSWTNKEIQKYLGSETPAHDYVNDAAACIEALEELGQFSYLRPTTDGKKVCIFDFNGEIHVTVPFSKESHALATTLFFVLENKSRLT
ncbi:hypothetical protein QN372_00420 [Undibacterium sp. RTI2.1]|uniref:hypothetical protein n=1 Tax=unclassified Undibacterium TaxID=2630295 RepID=UPI002AB4BB1A|nr:MULTISPECIES: hypothetical protein [unclassified Undibacterium]MDY7537602.1 hypothetical protein [Undibacterium sp. 5I1]MEB0029203.1 hypothetical protein [Undibacterium sp. RTI2.1]MEB0115511.1 hypothetical protein [Undibacterium sp. RTI2.2]MEB0230147.1 hypothetical protein [Undibacterium sp. 10I3]MEB0256339.1 hypothetical protein [Undibacterium sp. 5I1]